MAVLTRRDMIRLLSLLVVSSDLGCSSDPPAGPPAANPVPTTNPPTPVADDAFTALQQVVDALRKSPDHLVAEAERLVAQKDPQAILTFVQSRIAEVLDHGESARDSLRYGARGALRGGAGTPRDKAELLADLYRRAGFSVKMVHGPVDEQSFGTHFQQELDRPFSLALPEATVTQLKKLLDAGVEPIAVDMDGSESALLASRLLDALGMPDLQASDIPEVAIVGPGLLDLPFVEVTTAAGAKVANPFVKGATLGTPYTTEAPSPLGEALPAPRVTLRVEGITTAQNITDPGTPLMQATYGLDEVVGRAVTLSFIPVGSMMTLQAMDPDALKLFTPTIAVLDASMSPAERLGLVRADSVISTDTRVFTRSSSGDVQVGNRTLPSAEPSAALLAQIDQLSLTIDPSAFPQVSGRVVALDAQGNAISGISGSAFTVSEDGRPTGALCLGIPDVPPRVALLFDVSSSIPDEFRLPEQVSALARAIADQVSQAKPQAEFRVGSVGVEFGDPIVWSGGWTDSPALVESNAMTLATDGSELWAAIADAADAQPTTIVVVTDGDATDELTTARREAVQSGPPVVVIQVGAADVTLPAQVAAFSHGKVFPVAEQAAAVAAVVAFVTSPNAQPTLLSYDAIVGGNAARTVLVTVGSKSTTATYTVPANPTATPTRFGGFKLTIELGADKIERAVAGWFRHQGGAITEDDLADTRAALLGGQLISFEPANPPAAHLFDDVFSPMLARKALVAAAKKQDAQGAMEELKKLPAGLTATMVGMMGPFGNRHLGTIPYVRATRYARKIRIVGQNIEAISTTDVLRFTRFLSKGTDRAAALRASMEQSLALQLVEAKMGSGSAMSALGGPIKKISPQTLEADYGALTQSERTRWERALEHYEGWLFLGPEDGKTIAFFAIDPSSGTVVCAAESGSGDNTHSNCGTFRDVRSALAILNMGLLPLTAFAPISPLVQVGFGLVNAYVEAIMFATAHVASLSADIVAAGVALVINTATDMGFTLALILVRTGSPYAAGTVLVANEFRAAFQLASGQPFTPATAAGASSNGC